MSNIALSFVVDKLPLHYYQAELLLYSLEECANFNKSNIIVQCLFDVDKQFVDFLEKNEYNYIFIEPFLDKKYCNKLRQLDYFIQEHSFDGVILMDTDMFVVEPLELETEYFLAKIVDAPNPTLKTLQQIYNAARLHLPEQTFSDWNIKNNETLDNNFNGGFYYIPSKYISLIQKDWKKWASWLYERPELFELKQQFIHIDQIAMGLAIQEHTIAYKHLSANYNFPTHYSNTLASLDKNSDIKILHYHRGLDSFGFIEGIDTNSKAHHAIQKANKLISQKNNLFFFKKYKESFHPKRVNSKELVDFKNRIKDLTKQKKFQLILHAGTPKTGTTSIQHFMDENAMKLIDNGYYYPKLYLNTPAPKHQWIVGTLMSDNFDVLFEYIEKFYKEALNTGNIHTIILSTEGIYNHWWDYSDAAKTALEILGEYFDVSVWVFYREPVSFLESLYKQYLKNPQLPNVACYGKNLSFEEMYKDKWFIRHLDYLGFVLDCQYLFGKDSIKIFLYSQNVLQDICTELHIDSLFVQEKRENTAQSFAVVDVLKVINKYNLSVEDKKKCIKILKDLDTIMHKYASQSVISEKIKNKILQKFSLESKVLKEKAINL